MKKTISILSALFTLSILLCIASCTKKQQPDTLFTRVAGRWKKIQYATDDNNNGIIDQQEIRVQPANFTDVLFFKLSDTTGYEAVDHDNFIDTSTFKWFVGGDSLYISYAAHLSLRYHIENVSSATLTILTRSSAGLAWYRYGKD